LLAVVEQVATQAAVVVQADIAKLVHFQSAQALQSQSEQAAQVAQVQLALTA
jgi:hypothetical protein